MKYSLRFSIRNFFFARNIILGKTTFHDVAFLRSGADSRVKFQTFRAYRNNGTVVFHHKCAVPRSGFDIVPIIYIACHTAQGMFICHHHCFTRIPVVGNNHLHKRRLGCHRPSCACQHSFAFAQQSLLHNGISEMEFLPIGIPYRCHMRHFHVSDSQFLTARISAADYHYFCHVVLLQRKACCKHHSLEQRKRQVQTRRARTSFLVQNETRTNAFVHFSRKKDISVIDCGKAGERFGSGDGEKPHYKHARLYHRSQISSTKTENESAGTHALGARHLPPYYSGQKAGRNMQAAQQKQEQHKHAAREHTQKTNAQTRRKPIRIPETSSGITSQTNAILSASHVNKTARFLTRKKTYAL